jgi:hypothetical protein
VGADKKYLHLYSARYYNARYTPFCLSSAYSLKLTGRVASKGAHAGAKISDIIVLDASAFSPAQRARLSGNYFVPLF